MINKSKFITFLRNEPLIQAEPSITAIKPNLFTEKGSIFIGVGLMSTKSISVGVPFDILGMILEAEALRKFLNFETVFILIADEHAKSNNSINNSKIDEVCVNTFNTISKIISNLNLTNFVLVKSSDLFLNNEFKSIVNSLPNFENEYLKLEIADLIWFTKKNHVKIKIGWTMEDSSKIKGHDERFFDREIIKFCPNLSLIHLKPGRTFNKHRQRVSPYLSIVGETRIILQPDENVQNKIKQGLRSWPDPNFNGTLRHLANIVRLFDRLNGNIPETTLEKKIHFIIHRVLKE